MAKPTQKPSRLGKAPTSLQSVHTVSNNTSKPGNFEMVPLNFKVDAEFRRDLKSFAVNHDMTMVSVVKEAFTLYKQHKNG